MTVLDSAESEHRRDSSPSAHSHQHQGWRVYRSAKSRKSSVIVDYRPLDFTHVTKTF